MKDQRSRAPASVDNIYKLDGRVPVGKAIPFGLQHVLAMFVANVTPVMLIASVAVYNGQAFTAIDTALLIQAAMLVAGIGTLIQLYPVWRIGSRLQSQRYSMGLFFRISTSKSERILRSMASGSSLPSSKPVTAPAARTPPSTREITSSPAPGSSWMR